MDDRKRQYCKVVKRVLIIESVLFIVGGVIVTNMHPDWMQVSVTIMLYLVIATGIAWVVLCRYR